MVRNFGGASERVLETLCRDFFPTVWTAQSEIERRVPGRTSERRSFVFPRNPPAATAMEGRAFQRRPELVVQERGCVK